MVAVVVSLMILSTLSFVAPHPVLGRLALQVAEVGTMNPTTSPAVQHLRFGLTAIAHHPEEPVFLLWLHSRFRELAAYQPFGVEHRVERVQDVGEGHVTVMVHLPRSLARVSTRPCTPRYEDVVPRSRRKATSLGADVALASRSHVERGFGARGGGSWSCSALLSWFGTIGIFFIRS